MRVAVCVVTYRRPEGLRRLLESLAAQTFRDDPPELEIVVVDNEADGTSAAVCDLSRADSKWPIRHDVESRRGIPFARNKAVGCVVDTADFVAFIDDDEVAEPDWLDQLLRVQRLHQADVVTGPVLSHFPDGLPEWLTGSVAFRVDQFATGHLVDKAYTNNVLVRVGVFGAMDTVFDERMAMTGGSDTHFFRRVVRAGFKIVWANEAVVTEWIPRSRARLRWVLQRAYRVGNSAGLIEADLNTTLRSRLRFLMGVAVRMAEGLVLLPLSALAGRRLLVRALRRIFQSAGMLTGLTGKGYEEYRQTHGA